MRASSAIVVVTLLTMASIGSAWADRGEHIQFGILIGIPGPWYEPPPYYYPAYYPPLVVQPQQPPVYIEQQSADIAPPSPSTRAPEAYWYFCEAAKGYYPYVRACPGGWQQVLPQPPGPH